MATPLTREPLSVNGPICFLLQLAGIKKLNLAACQFIYKCQSKFCGVLKRETFSTAASSFVQFNLSACLYQCLTANLTYIQALPKNWKPAYTTYLAFNRPCFDFEISCWGHLPITACKFHCHFLLPTR